MNKSSKGGGFSQIDTRHEFRQAYVKCLRQFDHDAEAWLTVSVFQVAYVLGTDVGVLAELFLGPPLTPPQLRDPSSK